MTGSTLSGFLCNGYKFIVYKLISGSFAFNLALAKSIYLLFTDLVILFT